MRAARSGIDMALFLSSAWPFIVLAFVLFFYCLGALYDDRKDRSVLFWKSLPVSDAQTVLSKVASAVLVAPVLACRASLVAYARLPRHGQHRGAAARRQPAATLIWGPASPLRHAPAACC